MINSFKTIAFFGCSLTSRYREGLCQCFNIAAKKRGMNIVYFNFLGRIGEKNAEFGECELDIIDYVNLDEFDGIIYDGEGFNEISMAEKVINKLRGAKCPVVSISGHVEGFHNIEFEDASGMRKLVEHFTDVHKHTRIGFMSGFLTHPDARLRLDMFREVMREKGLPEDGAGVFEGDFWFHKGEEAADFFLSRPERPQSIVCANDYMAISLITAFKQRGIKVPNDIAVSGYDGTTEGKEYIPHLTTATRERRDIAEKAMSLLVNLSNDLDPDIDTFVSPRTVFEQSCGCKTLDYETEANSFKDAYKDIRMFSYCLNDAEAAMLKLNKVEKLELLEETFRKCATNFGNYSAFFLFLQTDKEGRIACSSGFDKPTEKFRPIIWIDEKNEYLRSDRPGKLSGLIPNLPGQDSPHFYYIMSSYCAERFFGYAVIEMKGNDIFSEFYNIFLLNLSVTLERLWKNDNINTLYEKQKALYEKQMELSIHDELTGILNRRGFNELSQQSFESLNGKSTVCTMVMDMDRLKHINDVYGHNEGDFAIKTASQIIIECCKSGEIAGRAGGDEFYIYASDYSQEKLDRFNQDLARITEIYNARINKPYRVELSCGSYLCETDKNGSLEEFLRISDLRMYDLKMSKYDKQSRR